MKDYINFLLIFGLFLWIWFDAWRVKKFNFVFDRRRFVFIFILLLLFGFLGILSPQIFNKFLIYKNQSNMPRLDIKLFYIIFAVFSFIKMLIYIILEHNTLKKYKK